MLADESCWFLAVDFDRESWKLDAVAAEVWTIGDSLNADVLMAESAGPRAIQVLEETRARSM